VTPLKAGFPRDFETIVSDPKFPRTQLESLVPELLEANGCLNVGDIPFELLARKYSVAHGIHC
jgi:hypothetical protein